MTRKKVVLFPSAEQALEKVGANIKRARLRRNIRAELLEERAGISTDTLSAINKWQQSSSYCFWNGIMRCLLMAKKESVIHYWLRLSL